MKQNLKQTFVLAVSILLISPCTFAKKGKGARIFKQLDLSKEQSAQIKEIRTSRKDKMKALKAKKKEARKNLKEAMESNASNSKLKSLHAKVLSAHSNFKEYKFKTMLKTRALLTPTQKAKFSELKKEHRSKKRRRHDEDED